MAWAIRSTTTNAGASAESVTIGKPTNTDGDGIVIGLSLGAARTVTMPTGFLEVTTGNAQRQLWYKPRASGEGTGDYTLTWTGGGATTSAVIATACYEDGNGQVNFDSGSAGGSTGAATTDHLIPAVTVSTPNSILIGYIGSTGAGSALTFTSAALTELADIQNGTAHMAWMGWTTQANAGSSGTKAATASVSSTGRGGIIIFYVPTEGRAAKMRSTRTRARRRSVR